ncbi:hypothetical protein ACLKA6_005211 [Drosophila palustris]
MWMKRSAVLGQGVATTQRNFLRENKLLVRQTPMLTMRRTERERERMSPSYELPTTASMGRRAITPPLIETQRRLIEGGRIGRAYYAAEARRSSEKQIQTEDISDEQFLNAALLKCTEQGHGHGQGQGQGIGQGQGHLPLRGCSEGDEPLLMANAGSGGYDDTGGLRRTTSNFELRRMAAQRSSYHTVLGAATTTLPRTLDGAKARAVLETSKQQLKLEQEQPATMDNDGLSVSSDSVTTSSQVMQLPIPDITDVEQNPQLDQSLSARTNASACSCSKTSKRDDKSPLSDKMKAQNAVDEQERERRRREREWERERDRNQVGHDQVLLPEPQRIALLQAAQARYRDLIWQYNRLPISMGTLRVRNLKIELEHELDRIDSELNFLCDLSVATGKVQGAVEAHLHIFINKIQISSRLCEEMSDSVTVALRVRPLVKSELERGCRIAVQRAVDGTPQVTVNRNECFTYNYVFDSDDSQQAIYESCVRDKLKKLLHGYNITILAYGQTGSGKTYTMGTAFDGIMDENVGVIPRAVHEIFQETAAMQNEYHFKITCSFVELYQEQFFDLFSSNKREESTVDIREDKNRIVIPGLTEVEVSEAKQVTDQLMRGSSGRAVASTAMNETSSRSHAIFTLTVIATMKTGQKSVTTSKFNLVDLAGSERCSKTLACGDRFKEGVNINKGLLALGNVINVLGSGQTAGYVPYRQSKLTRLLQDSLGGNSITLMIACVSPADYNVAETLSTLRYADRALQIKNKPVVNMDPHAAEVMMLKDVIQKLRMELLANGGGGSGGNVGGLEGAGNGGEKRMAEQLQQLQEANARIEKKNRRLQQELQQALIDLAENEMRAHIAEVTHDKLKAHVLELKAKLTAAPTVPQIEELVEQSQSDALWQQQLREITQLVTFVDEELQQTESALQTHRKECLNGSGVAGVAEESSSSGCEETHELMQSRTEEHTMKQLNLNGELRNINRQLDLKQELHDRVTRNFFQLQDDDIDEKFKQCELKIGQLEAERRELMEQLRTTKQKDTSAKLAEERRKRLQALEQEVSEMRRKMNQQASMLKMREKEREKIQNLSSEIRAMKESKVKLIRAMRCESERFRQWKLMSEKQLTQLKSKDRKMQSEMVRQETLHAKQRQVLKRKCEEAMATNKRLKDALERQRAAQAQRQRHAKDQPGAAKLDALVDRELEVILSLIDAEHSLEQLMEDRAIINAHCNEIKQQQPKPEEEQAQLLASLEEELEMRNAQIADLQQKVCSNDLDSRMRALCENVQSVGESRAITKQLLKSIVQQRREQAQGIMEQKMLLDEQRSQLNEAQQQREALSKRLRQVECEHEELMVNQQRSYEEKVAVLLRSQHMSANVGDNKVEDIERQQIVEEMLRKKEELQQEVDKLKLKSQSQKRPIVIQSEDTEDECEFVSELDFDDEMNNTLEDPEWKPTKRARTSNNTSKLKKNPNPNSSNDVQNTSDSSSMQMTIQDSSSAADETRKASKRCKCRTKCDTKRCGCFSNGLGCGSSCKCSERCINPYNADGNPDKENSTSATATAQNVTVTLKELFTQQQQHHFGS